MAEYAPPVLRAPSPASSVGTAYGPDQTAFSDTESQLPQPAFEKKWTDRLGLGAPRRQELEANTDPLLAVPKNPTEEKALYDRVMQSLRFQVHQLEENELFDQTLLRGSQAALEQQPTSNDINTLMRSLMSPVATGNDPDTTVASGPWNTDNSRNRDSNDATDGGVAPESWIVPGQSARGTLAGKGKRRSRKD